MREEAGMELHEYEAIDENVTSNQDDYLGRWLVPGGWLYERTTKYGVALAFVPNPQTIPDTIKAKRSAS